MKKHSFKILISVGLIPLLVGYLGKLNWMFDVFSHFRVYYILYFLFLGLIALLFKKKKEAIASAFLALLLMLTLAKFYLPNPGFTNEEGLKVTSINLLSSNQEYEKVIDFIKEGDFDVIFFQELNNAWEENLKQLQNEYPTNYMYPRNDNFGIGVFSRIPFYHIEKIDFSSSKIPSLLVSTSYKNQKLHILNTHPLPPIREYYFDSRNQQFKNLNAYVETFEGELLLLGDLNSTNFSPNFDLLLQNGRLRDSRKGFGLLPTWNAHWSLISITLDHALVTDGIEVINRGIGESIGSDHLPITIEVGVLN